MTIAVSVQQVLVGRLGLRSDASHYMLTDKVDNCIVMDG